MVAGRTEGAEVTSIDTNILFYGFAKDRKENPAAQEFLAELSSGVDVVLSEFVLVEFYRLLRNSAALDRPLAAKEAAEVVQRWRKHPRWQIVGFSTESEKLHDELWKQAGCGNFAARRIFDARLALVLRQFGVTEFATANVKDFEGFGFKKVWNPVG